MPVRLRVVFALPALLNVAVSPVPGGPPAVQLVLVDQVLLVVPFQVALPARMSPTESASRSAAQDSSLRRT